MANTAPVLGIFPELDTAVDAIGRLKQTGIRNFIVYAPYPSHELEHAIEPHQSPIRIFTLVGALTGTATGFALGTWTSLAKEYEPWQWSAYKPSLTEMTIMVGSFGWFFLLFLLFMRVLPPVAVAELKEVLPPPMRNRPALGVHGGATPGGAAHGGTPHGQAANRGDAI